MIFSSLGDLRRCPQVLIDGQLLHRVKVEDCMWSVDKKAHLIHIDLEKAKELMWKSIFEVCRVLPYCNIRVGVIF